MKRKPAVELGEIDAITAARAYCAMRASETWHNIPKALSKELQFWRLGVGQAERRITSATDRYLRAYIRAMSVIRKAQASRR